MSVIVTCSLGHPMEGDPCSCLVNARARIVEEVPTECPGLVLRCYRNGDESYWNVTHERSQAAVTDGYLIKRDAVRVFDLLAGLADWTLPAAELVGTPLLVDAMHRLKKAHPADDVLPSVTKVRS